MLSPRPLNAPGARRREWLRESILVEMSMDRLETGEIVVATITRARDAAETELLLSGLERLSAHGMPVFAADGGSVERFRERARELPSVTLVPVSFTEGPRLVQQVRASLRAAAGAGARSILYTEPDKREFFAEGLGALLQEAARYPDAGVVFPSRNSASFATFPAGQQLTERHTNELFAEVLGQEGDFCYGPLLLKQGLVPALLEAPLELGWGWRFAALALSHRAGWPVVPVSGDFPCPPDQRGEDDLPSRLYRLEQMSQNVAAMAYGWKAALPDVDPVR